MIASAPFSDVRVTSRRGSLEADKWAQQKLIALRNSCEENHGVAIRPYLQYLIKNKSTLQKTIAKCMGEFESAISDMKLNGALQHAARNFALVYAGGCLARRGRRAAAMATRSSAFGCGAFLSQGGGGVTRAR